MSIGPFVISLPRLFFLIGVMSAVGASALLFRGDDRLKRSEVLWTSILSGAMGARVAYVLTHLQHYRDHPLEMLFVWDGGLHPIAGLATTLAIATWLAIRRDIRSTHVAASLAVGMSVWGLLHVMQSSRIDKAPLLADTTFRNIDGTTTALKSFTGKPVVLNLWATWCPPCRREMPVLAAAQAGHEDTHFLFVNQNQPAQDVIRYLAAQKLSLDNVLLDQGSLAVKYDAPGLPTTLFFDRGGQLKYVHLGELSAPRLADYLRSISDKDNRSR